MDKNDNLKKLVIEGIQEKKGHDITIVDMSAIESAPTQMFIIAEGKSSMQVTAIADSVREYVQKHSGIKPFNYDGYATSRWIVIDYGWLLVHIFVPEDRERYCLEELWSDATITDIPNLD